MTIKKRQFLSATLVLALGAAVAVNWYYSGGVPLQSQNETTTAVEQVSGNLGDSLYVAGTTAAYETTQQNQTQSEYFAKAKLEKENSHDEVIDSLEDIIENDGINEENKQQIQTMLNEFCENVKAETDAENLITAKTASQCVVIINGDSCQVIMEKNSLNDTVILQITEIIEKNTNIFAENLTIIEIK